MLSDTVGFISDLPHELVEAFRATLEEVKEADVVLHVRDIASEETQAQAGDVRTVLERLGVDMDERRIVEVWNKIDLLPAEDWPVIEGDARRAHPPAIPVSAVTGQGCPELLSAVAALVDETPAGGRLRTGRRGRAAIAWLYRNGRGYRAPRRQGCGRVRLADFSLSPQALGQFEQLFPTSEVRASSGG